MHKHAISKANPALHYIASSVFSACNKTGGRSNRLPLTAVSFIRSSGSLSFEKKAAQHAKKKVTQMLLRRERLSAKNGPQLLELGVCFDCCGAGVAGVDKGVCFSE